MNALLIFSTAFVIVILKAIPNTDSILEIGAYLTGGPSGIVASMWVHRRTLGRKKC